MTKTKRALAALLAIVLLVALLSTTAFAAGDYRETGKITLGQNYDGKAYHFYQILGMEVNSTTGAYRYVLLGNDWDTFINNNPTYFTVTDGKYVTTNFASNTTQAAAVAKLAAAYADGKDSLKTSGYYTVAGTGTANQTVTDSAKVGYYLMCRNTTDLASLGSVLPTKNSAEAYNLAIYDKNEEQKLTKEFTDGLGGEVIGTPSYEVGDVMSFRITAVVTKDEVLISEVILTDTMTGLTNLQNLTVYYSKYADGYATTDAVPGAKVHIQELVAGKEYEIRIQHPTDGSFALHDRLILEYNATVTEEAISGGVMKNEVESDYFEPGIGGDTPEVGGSTYEFTLRKTDNAANPLQGAGFELYESGALVPLVAKSGYYRPATEAEQLAPGFVSATITTGADGKAVIKGLKKDTAYSLKETVVPAGYVQASDTGFMIVTTADDPGEIEDKGTVTVINVPGTELPSTGGMGTTIFYVAGLVLVLAAVTVLVSKKRANA